MSTAKRNRQKQGRRMRQEALGLARKKAVIRKRFTFLTVVVLVIAVIFAVTNDSPKKPTAKKGTATTRPFPAKSADCPADMNNLPVTKTFSAPQPFCLDQSKKYIATMTTDVGDIQLSLDSAIAPSTANNFVMLARYHYYDGLTFHRVIKDFMVQGGDPKGDGTGGPGYQFNDELPATVDAYKAGSLAMANSGPNTNGSQFFIVVSDNGGANLGTPNYSLFGQVTSGLEVVKAIEADGGVESDGKPTKLHTITKVTISES